MKNPRLAGLYAITAGARPDADLPTQVGAALRGGARLIQYRDKGRDAGRRLDEARQLQALCAIAGALFVVNDDVALASAVGADGVHLGEDDEDPRAVRDQTKGALLVGVSCYDSLERAVRAQASGVDYVAFGAFYTSPTKPQARSASVTLLKDARAALHIPVCAIGGITAANGRTLVAAGADMLAVSSALFRPTDIETTAKEMSAHWFA